MMTLNKNQMNAVMGGGKMTTVHIKIYTVGTKSKSTTSNGGGNGCNGGGYGGGVR